MAANSRGGMRPNSAGKTPSFIVIGLMVVIAILGFNYWNVSSKNSVLVKELSEMSERMRLTSVKKLSVEKRNEALLDKVRENEGELDKHKQLSQRKEEEVNNLNSQLETKRSEADQQQQELSRLKQDNDICNSNSQDLETKLDQATEAKSECEVKLATDKEDCEKRVQAASTNQGSQDCSAQIKTSQMSLLNIIHKLWGNKAIIVLQDAGIDVSGIQLDTNGGGQLPAGGTDQRREEQQIPGQSQGQYPQQGQGQYPQQGQGQYPQQGQGQPGQEVQGQQQQQGQYPQDAQQQFNNQQGLYQLDGQQQLQQQQQEGAAPVQAGLQQQDQQQQQQQPAEVQQHQDDNQQAMGQQPADGSPGQVGQVQPPVDRDTYNQQNQPAEQGQPQPEQQGQGQPIEQGQGQDAGAGAPGQLGLLQGDKGQLGVQPAGGDGGGAPDAPADREQLQAPEARVVLAAPDQHQAPQGQEGALQPPQGQEGALQPPPQDGAAAAAPHENRDRGDGNLRFQPVDPDEIEADEDRIDDIGQRRRFGQNV